MHTVVLITGYARSGKDTFRNGMFTGNQRCPGRGYNYADGLKEAANKYLDWVGLGDKDFYDDEFKAQNRHILVELGRFARSIDVDVFANLFVEDCLEFAKDCQRIGADALVVNSDWRYLNELRVTQARLGDLKGWRVITVRIDTDGIGPANEEEGLSIGEITREVAPDYCFVFGRNNPRIVEAEGKNLARILGV